MFAEAGEARRGFALLRRRLASLEGQREESADGRAIDPLARLRHRLEAHAALSEKAGGCVEARCDPAALDASQGGLGDAGTCGQLLLGETCAQAVEAERRHDAGSIAIMIYMI